MARLGPTHWRIHGPNRARAATSRMAVERALAICAVFAVALGACLLGEFKLAVVAGTLAYLLPLLLPINSISKRAISLEALAMLTLGAYSLSVPWHQLVYADYNAPVVELAFSCCLLGGIGTVLGFALGGQNGRGDYSPEPSWKRYYQIGWIVFVVGMLTAAVAVAATVGFAAYLNAGYAGRALLKREAGPIELGLYHAVLGLVFVNLARLKSPGLGGRRRSWLLVGAISLGFVAYVSFLGIRRPSFFLVMSMVMLYGVAGRGYSKLRIATLVLPALLLFSMFANFRQVLSDQGVTAATEFVSQNVSFEWFDLSSSELGAPYRVLMDVLSTWSDDPARLGATYLEAIPYVLPKAAGINVQSLSQEYTVRNFAESFIAIGGNMGFFPVAEAYVNFGILGIMPVFVVIGYLVNRIQFRAVARGGALDVVAFAIAAPWFVFFVRSDLASFAKVFVYSIVVPYLFAVFLLAAWRRRIGSMSGWRQYSTLLSHASDAPRSFE